ncbi:methyltransferase [Streptomyces sp. NRRL F-5053]|uniref:methyltransferase n=1 Tax=Streptomyces sp. NRRL F-5053 TaxID=1463854 RepID=UPI0004C5EC34|nr:methyltransferase [Streptomyces sp. NRRL F-5053]
MTPYRHVTVGDIRVSYTPELDGGGAEFGQAFVPFVRAHLGPVDRLLEWCAGPGFIGFSLLSAGLCTRLDLADVNADTGPLVRDTVRANGLHGRAVGHISDCFAQIPRELRWDLVVGNPPHVNSEDAETDYRRRHPRLIWQDSDWAVHRRFYRQVPGRLRPGGNVVLQENHRFSSPDDFKGLVEDAGLEHVGVFDCGPGLEDYYFVWSRLPAGARS